MEPKISIVIPCYNDAQYIEQAVDSAMDQTYPNIEVIVVDDGSDDATKTVLEKIRPKITKLVTQTNQGQSTARNRGIEIASGDLILTLDSDDYFEPTFCELAVKEFQKESEVKLVSCEAQLHLANGKTLKFQPKGGTISDFMFLNNALGTSMFKKADWAKIGRYDESMRQGFEDWEFFIRLLKDGGSCTVIKEALYHYRKRENSTTNRANKVKFDILKFIYLKHSDLYKDNFEAFVTNLLAKVENEEREKLKNRSRIETRIGMRLLKPFRFLKSKFS